jgi:hypothetical protein
LTHYGYRQNLTELRQAVKSFEIGFWTDTFYNRWLNILQTLNNPTTNPDYPQTMRTSAWADKILHTQLASWAQLRHNCLLYVKQSVTTHLEMICQYPAGYVEPYPDFFAAVADFARFGRSLFQNSQLLRLPAQDDWPEHCRATHNKIIAYFDHLADVAGRLQVMAEKELHLEPFTDEETIFLKSVVIRQDYLPQAYGGPSYDQRWNGWYPRLFIYADRSPKKIADIHTNLAENPDSPLYPPRVLYVGTGPVATTLFIADTDEGSTVYVGPSFTYFEVVEKGSPPLRLTDQAWEERLAKTPYPEPPRWTRTFRYPVSCHPDLLNVPNRIDKMSPQQN